MDGENLYALDPNSFDAVISRVGLIYFPDQQKTLTGMHRVLKPNGRVAAIVYSTAENNKFFSIPVSIIRRRAQLPTPLPGQPGPFSLGASGVLEATYQRAGFRDIQSRYPSDVYNARTATMVVSKLTAKGRLSQFLVPRQQRQPAALMAYLITRPLCGWLPKEQRMHYLLFYILHRSRPLTSFPIR
jgi:SAM-dependent methyltransferase